MKTLVLEKSEKNIVVEALESFLSDLRMEISHTDNRDYREDLKYRKTVISKMIRLLKQEHN